MDSFDELIDGLELDVPDATATNMIFFLGTTISLLEEGVRCLMDPYGDDASRFAMWALSLRDLEPSPLNMLVTLELHSLAILSMDYLDESAAGVTLVELSKGLLGSHEVYRNLENVNVEAFWDTYLHSVIPVLENTQQMGDEFRSLIRAFWDVSDDRAKHILVLEAADLIYELVSFLQKEYYTHMSKNDVWTHFISNFRSHHTDAVEGKFDDNE